MLDSGRLYRLVNGKAGTVLDLSGSDNRSLIGYDWHDGHNQKWYLEENGGVCTLRNHHSGQYLGIEGRAEDGTPVVAVNQPFQWGMRQDEQAWSTFRLFIPDTPYNLDLSDHGNPTPGTLVTLWREHPGKNQTWRFEQV